MPDNPEPDDLLNSVHDLFGQLANAQQRHPVIRTGDREPISEFVRLAVKMRDGFACVWCFSTHELQLDHIVPWSAGGSDDATNLRTLCGPCNQSRSNRHYAGDTGPRLPVAAQCTRCNTPAEPEWSDLHIAFCLGCRSRGRAFTGDLH